MVKLSEIGVKEKCKVVKVVGSKSIKKRLLEMGFVRGTDIYVEKLAPLGDPMELVLKGYHVSLRREEANDVYVAKA
ncbi:MAG: FeoA domain-containing protein [Candidatus Omnitrophica bacterium]|nr:FeoA domain-containing protein [Candidatus Omnitrophota bacterium]